MRQAAKRQQSKTDAFEVNSVPTSGIPGVGIFNGSEVALASSVDIVARGNGRNSESVASSSPSQPSSRPICKLVPDFIV
jgi:hypothetical protein